MAVVVALVAIGAGDVGVVGLVVVVSWLVAGLVVLSGFGAALSFVLFVTRSLVAGGFAWLSAHVAGTG